MPGRARIVVPLQPGFNEAFRSRDGMVGRDLSRRATRVQLAAKRQVGVATGMLKRDITKNWIRGNRGDLAIRVGSDRYYALWHHEGTRPHIIRPKSKRALRFTNKAGDVIFARVVHHPGTRANEYLSDNLRLAAD